MRQVISLGTMSIALVASIGLAAPAEARDNRLRAESRLVPAAGAPLQAFGETEIEIRGSRTEFKVEIEDVAPGAYDLYVNGVLEAVITAVVFPGGVEGEVEFRNPVQPGKILLDFDPVNAAIEVRQGETLILSGVAPDPANAASPPGGSFNKQKEEIVLVATDAFPPARGKAKFKSEKNKAELKVETIALPAGPYDVVVDGFTVGTLTSNGRKGKAEFSTRSSGRKQTMDFDPTNTTLEISSLGVVFLTGTLPGTPMGGGMPGAGVAQVSLAPTADAPGAEGKARLRLRSSSRDFNVEIEDLPLGVYDLFVDGVDVADITVVATDDSPEGEVEFKDPVEPGKILLDFDPQEKTIQVARQSDGVVVLAGTLPTASGQANGGDDDDDDDDSDDDDSGSGSDDDDDDSDDDDN